MKRRFYQLDVFTTKAFTGNPLAVVIDGDGLSGARMQAVAREMNLSETVFVQKPTTNQALARLRIFTTVRELPLAGHPVIGTWFLLAGLGVVPAREGSVVVRQQTGAGILPVEIAFRDGRPTLVTMTQKPARFRSVGGRRATLAAALGLRPSDFNPSLPMEAVSTGIFNLMVPLRERSGLKRIRLNAPALSQALAGHDELAYCFALGGAGKAYARAMIPWGLVEDPATGSAGGSLGAYLVRHGRLKPGATLEILQGVEMGRPSHIRVEVRQESRHLVPLVSGAAVCVLEGQVEA